MKLVIRRQNDTSINKGLVVRGFLENHIFWKVKKMFPGAHSPRIHSIITPKTDASHLPLELAVKH
jgi:hypothetical protein